MPGLLKHFTTAQINALIAPRAHLAVEGLQDKLVPVEGLTIIDKELTRVYAEAGHPERWLLRPTTSDTRKHPKGGRRCSPSCNGSCSHRPPRLAGR